MMIVRKVYDIGCIQPLHCSYSTLECRGLVRQFVEEPNSEYIYQAGSRHAHAIYSKLVDSCWLDAAMKRQAGAFKLYVWEKPFSL